MARNKKKGGARRRNTSTLRQHRQQGKTLLPPFAALPGPIRHTPWLRDTFPDMLWLAMLITEYGTKGMHMAAKVLDRIDDVLDDPSGPSRPEKLVITGQLQASRISQRWLGSESSTRYKVMTCLNVRCRGRLPAP